MNDCRQENCPFRSNHSSSVYRCDYITCPNRRSESVTYTLSDRMLTDKVIKKDPCESCKYRKVMVRLYDAHFWAEDCPTFQKCSFGENHAKSDQNNA